MGDSEGVRDSGVIEFLATFPPTANAIQMHGDEGMRIVLDIADSEVGEAIQLIKYRNKQMRVRIEGGE